MNMEKNYEDDTVSMVTDTTRNSSCSESLDGSPGHLKCSLHLKMLNIPEFTDKQMDENISEKENQTCSPVIPFVSASDLIGKQMKNITQVQTKPVKSLTACIDEDSETESVVSQSLLKDVKWKGKTVNVKDRLSNLSEIAITRTHQENKSKREITLCMEYCSNDVDSSQETYLSNTCLLEKSKGNHKSKDTDACINNDENRIQSDVIIDGAASDSLNVECSSALITGVDNIPVSTMLNVEYVVNSGLDASQVLFPDTQSTLSSLKLSASLFTTPSPLEKVTSACKEGGCETNDGVIKTGADQDKTQSSLTGLTADHLTTQGLMKTQGHMTMQGHQIAQGHQSQTAQGHLAAQGHSPAKKVKITSNVAVLTGSKLGSIPVVELTHQADVSPSKFSDECEKKEWVDREEDIFKRIKQQQDMIEDKLSSRQSFERDQLYKILDTLQPLLRQLSEQHKNERLQLSEKIKRHSCSKAERSKHKEHLQYLYKRQKSLVDLFQNHKILRSKLQQYDNVNKLKDDGNTVITMLEVVEQKNSQDCREAVSKTTTDSAVTKHKYYNASNVPSQSKKLKLVTHTDDVDLTSQTAMSAVSGDNEISVPDETDNIITRKVNMTKPWDTKLFKVSGAEAVKKTKNYVKFQSSNVQQMHAANQMCLQSNPNKPQPHVNILNKNIYSLQKMFPTILSEARADTTKSVPCTVTVCQSKDAQLMDKDVLEDETVINGSSIPSEGEMSTSLTSTKSPEDDFSDQQYKLQNTISVLQSEDQQRRDSGFKEISDFQVQSFQKDNSFELLDKHIHKRSNTVEEYVEPCISQVQNITNNKTRWEQLNTGGDIVEKTDRQLKSVPLTPLLTASPAISFKSPPFRSEYSRTVDLISPSTDTTFSDVFQVKSKDLFRKIQQRLSQSQITQDCSESPMPIRLQTCTEPVAVKAKSSLQKPTELGSSLASRIKYLPNMVSKLPRSLPDKSQKENGPGDCEHDALKGLNKEEFGGLKFPPLDLLIEKEYLHPGCEMSVKSKENRTYVGTLMDNGMIRGPGGEVFKTLVQWVSAVNDGCLIKKSRAYKEVYTRGRSLLSIIRGNKNDADNSATDTLISIGNRGFKERDKPMADNPENQTQDLLMLMKQCTVHLLSDDELVYSSCLPDNFWAADFDKCVINSSFWSQVDYWT